jgi:hypothetical protein
LKILNGSIGDLERLVSLNLKFCRSLKKLPGKNSMLNSLEELILSGCLNLVELPKALGKMESLRVLRVDGIAITKHNKLALKIRRNSVGLGYYQRDLHDQPAFRWPFYPTL